MVSRIAFTQVLGKPLKSVLGLNSVENFAKMMSTNVPKFDQLSVTVPKEFVYHVEMNRPEKLNSYNDKMFDEIKQCFESLSENEDCRVVVLSAAGRLFTAGLDLSGTAQKFPEIAEAGDLARKAKLFHKVITAYQESLSSLELCKKPVIAAVHGACIGAGTNMIVAADMRFCTKDAYFTVKEVDIGLAADVGALQRLPKVIGSDSLARELCYTGRNFPADEALSCGLVTRVYDNKEEMIKGVTDLAEEIAKKSPVAVQTAKANLVYSRDHTVQEGLDHIRNLNQFMLQSEDLVTAVMAQMTKDSNVKFSKL